MKFFFLILFIISSFGLYSQEVLKFSSGKWTFYLTKKCTDERTITQIQVFEKGKLIQSIKPGENYFPNALPNAEIFIIEDMNFDGQQDFRLLEFLTASPDTPYLYWIYNPKTKRFQASSQYEEIVSPDFDYAKKEINSSWRNGCCEHGRDVYKLVKGVPKRVERFVIGHKSDGSEFSEHWKLMNGKLKLIKTKTN